MSSLTNSARSSRPKRNNFLPNGVGCGARRRHTPSDRLVRPAKQNPRNRADHRDLRSGDRLVSRLRHYDGVVLVALFLLVPIVELFVLIKVGRGIGIGNTIAVVLLVSIVGAWLVKREGLKTLRRIQEQLGNAKLPADELIDGGLIMFSGALMLTPGFVTDLFAIALLIPQIRRIVRRQVKARYGKRFAMASSMPFDFPGGGADDLRTESVIDVDSHVDTNVDTNVDSSDSNFRDRQDR
jgi:UPF0716 protein FxsA